jgi:hypothetical protein
MLRNYFRRPLYIVPVLCFLFASVSLGQCARSYFVADDFSWESTKRRSAPEATYDVINQHCCFGLGKIHFYTTLTTVDALDFARPAGFRYSRENPSYWENEFHLRRSVSFPLWPLTLFAYMLAFVLIARVIIRIRKERSGCCANCGYDLRASNVRCPECGRIIEAIAHD